MTKPHFGTVGILAGMGPRATAPFVDMVINECQAQYGAKYDEDFPPMMIYSLPVPFRADAPPDWETIEPLITAGLVRLESTGVDFIAMPCNTAHIRYDSFARSIGVPLLNMIDEALATIPSSANAISVLATRMTMNAGMYQRGVEAAGLTVVSREGWQDRVDQLITSIKSSPDRAASQRLWDDLISDVATAGADTILLGCTDLNAVDNRLPDGLSLLDATECLARAVVRQAQGASRVDTP
jgi:aspartate racemase